MKYGPKNKTFVFTTPYRINDRQTDRQTTNESETKKVEYKKKLFIENIEM